jgi:Domain of unknown function (DUF4333)
MSEPQGPDQQWSPGEPAQQPPGSEEGTAQVGWQEPAYAPTQYAQPQPYPGPPQFPQGQEFGQQPTQYAQPGQPGQAQPPQYGQPGYGQPGQFTPPAGPYGELPYGQAGAAEGSRRSVAIIGVIVGAVVLIVIAAVVITGLWWPGWFYVTTKLDVNEAQKGVQKILTDPTNGYGVKSADNVKCNNGQDPVVQKDKTFTCDVRVDGQHKTVTVTFQDDKGTYEVGRPK